MTGSLEKLMQSGDVNPLKADAELSMMLKKLDKVGKYKTFQKWKTKFLERLEQYLYEKGIDPAHKAGTDFDRQLNKFVKTADKVSDHIVKGELGSERKTVKASLALNEMCKELTHVVDTLKTLIPSTSKEEKIKGFTKFHLGAALIRQGFHQYQSMVACQDAVDGFSDKLGDVADKQQHELFDYYKTWVERFVGVMSDLGLYNVMMKCLEFAEAPEEEESSDEEDIHIEIEVSTPEGLKRIKLELDPRETVGNIKEAIAEDIGIAPDKQVMKFKGNELTKNGASLRDTGIVNGSKLTVEPFKIPITVKTYDGKSIPLLIDPETYISDIKRLVEPESGVPARNQKLLHKGEPLENDFSKASDCGIEAGAVIDMEPKVIKVTVEMPDGEKVELNLSPNDTDEEIKKKIEAETGMAQPRQVLKTKGDKMPRGIKIRDLGMKDGDEIKVEVLKVPVTVRTHDRKTFETMIDPTIYMSDLKRQIEPESGVPARNQKLSMNGQELRDDTKKAQDYDIKEGSIIDLEPKSIKVQIEMPDEDVVEIHISPSETPQALKKRIEEATGMEPPKQVLKFDGNEMPNDKALKEIGVKDGDKIKVETFKVPVTVKTWDGKTFETMVDPTIYMSDLKRQLEPDSGVPAQNQKVSMGGQELRDDTKKARDYGIQGGSVLDLEPKTIRVSVDMPDGDTIQVDISPSETPQSLKKKIEEVTGMEPPKQVLKFNGDVMPDDKLLKDIGVKDGDSIKVEIFKVPVTVKTYDGKTIETMVDPTMYMSDLKSQLEDESGIPSGNQKLFKDGSELDDDAKRARDYGIKGGDELYLEPKRMIVNVDMPDGKKAQVEITPNDTSDEIKEKIEETTGMAAPRQVLKKDGQELPVGRPAKDMGIQDGDTLSVDVFTVPVTVNTMDGKQIKIDVDPTDRLRDIKTQLEDESGIPWDNQQLFKDNNVLDDDNKTAGDHGIGEGDDLYLEPNTMKVTVDMPDGTKAVLTITPSETSADIKDKIEAETGMAAPRQVLKKAGAELPDGKTAKDMGLRDGDNLAVEVFKVPVTVKTMDGKVIKIDVDPTQKLRDIKKELLEEESGIPWENQRLYKDENELADDGKTAKDHGIGEGDELYLEPKMMSVTVDMPDGTKTEIAITPSDASADIKRKIEDKTGMEAPRQVLKKDGNELPEGSTVKDMGVRDGDNLSVDVRTVPVTVKTMDGKVIKIEVDPTNKLEDVKKQLEDEAGVPWDNQRLFKDDNELADDNKTAGEHGIAGGDELYLEPKKIIVTVDMPDGSKAEIEITPHDTSTDIKKKIETKTGMAAPRQVLKKDGRELPEGQTVKDIGIRNGDNLSVDVFKVPVTVNMMDGKQIKIDVDPTDKLGDIKKQLEEESGIPPDNQQLFKDGNVLADDSKSAKEHGIEAGDVLDLEPKKMVVTVDLPDGTRAEVEIKPADTSSEIKDKIEAKTGMAAPRQVLKKDGLELPNGRSAKDMGLKDGDNLAVDVFTVPVIVNTMDGKTIKIDVDPTDKLGDIKKQLQGESGIPWDNQRLFKYGNELEDDDKTAKEHGIEGGDVLDLEPKKMMVNVQMPDGSKTQVEITPVDTSDDIKQKIEDKTGMVAPRQVLKKDGRELPRGRTVKEMGIYDGDNLGVDIFTVPVTVRTMDGKQIKIDVDPSDTLGSVKKQLEPESGIPPSNQRLFKQDTELVDDNVTAGNHGIKEGDVLDLEPKSMRVQVEMPDGQNVEIDVTPADTSDDIKRKIKDKTGMAVPRQVVSHNGKELPKGKKARDMGIDEGSKLKVGIFKVPVTVDTMDGQKHKVMIDPTETLGDIKKHLEAEVGLPADNNRLYMDGKELADDGKTANDYGIKAGSQLDCEPKQIKVSVRLPDGSVITIFVKPSDKAADIKGQIEDKTGLAVKRQLLKEQLPNKEWLLPLNSTVKDLGIKEGAELFVDIYKIPIVVQTMDGEKKYDLQIEPSGPIDVVRHLLQRETGIDAQKMTLFFREEQMTDMRQSAENYGVEAHSLLTMDTILDAIVFVDIKCGTLFAMDREEVIAKGALTPNQGNKLDFLEAAKDSASRDKIKNAMMESPKLGFAPQVVVEKLDVEDYDVAEAEKVKGIWGVSLKKREKNKKGEELIYIDAKTGASGELSRKKYLENGFITPVMTEKGESLEQAETDTMKYDRFIHDIRGVFGVRSAK
mmetsp:Transcript_17796/g.33786  ORF Transcript_17796/g.33786 Transcript_17796/m.33786 type:complete len:2165 (-) Transcript_17796:45-6539(-)